MGSCNTKVSTSKRDQSSKSYTIDEAPEISIFYTIQEKNRIKYEKEIRDIFSKEFNIVNNINESDREDRKTPN
jgi:hypothetical protein